MLLEVKRVIFLSFAAHPYARRGPHSLMGKEDRSAPIGIFDAGVGGLSVLREIRRLLPGENLLYYADSRHCPYGTKTAEQIGARAVAITDELLAAGVKLIVVACNTATIAAIEQLRSAYPLRLVCSPEARREGQGCVNTCRSLWPPSHSQKKKINTTN